MNVRVLTTIEQLQEYREVWHSLLQATPRANYFQSLDWLEVYWQHFGDGQQLRVLVMSGADGVEGILPLVIRQEPTKVGMLRFVTYPMDHWGSYYCPIGPDSDAVLSAGFDYLSSIRSEWDVLELRWIGCEPEELQRTEALLQSSGYSPVTGDLDATALINLRGTWEDYLTSRGSKWRNNARRWERQLSALGEVQHVRHRPAASEDADPRWDLYEQCLRIAASSWQGSSTDGTTLSHESVSAFLRDSHSAAARSGCLDMNLLQIDGTAVAFTYNYVFRGNVYSLRSGFDPACPVKGAGSLLYAKAIEDSFRRGDWQYDLGPRHLECKRKLLTDVSPIYRLSCFKRWSVRQQLMRLKRQWDAPPLLPVMVEPVPQTASLP